MELVAEARRLLGLPEDEPQEDEIREAGGMTTTKPDCGYECGCPTLLEHRVRTIVNRIEAPIETPTLGYVLCELRNAIEEG